MAINIKSIITHISGSLLTIFVSLMGLSIGVSTANAASSSEAREMDVYYPGTEELKTDEMRVVACGTGMPSPRPKQAAACWLVELGEWRQVSF